MREIGSEFWNATSRESEEKYLLSGRTALDYIIRDLKVANKIESVLLPSWCCHTMIEPFVRNDVSVRFYDVFYDSQNGLSVEIPEPINNEIFYYMTYFGFLYLCGMDYQYIRNNWDYVIADETHSWLGEKQYKDIEIMPDYRYTSYRKWTGVFGIASAIKQIGQFQVDLTKKDAERYTLLRKKAAKIKTDYMNDKDIDKTVFLNLFNAAEEMLEKEYVDYTPSIEAIEQLINIDKHYIKEKRRCNANYLLQMLSDIKEVVPIFEKVNKTDVPLFVPILVNETDRNDLRKFLINQDIYCPVHWPVSDYHKGISVKATQMYNQELSLLCDQRYELEDMRTIVEMIKSFYNRRGN